VDIDESSWPSQKMRRAIDSPQGRALSSRRIATVEPVFVNIRYHKCMSRFTLRGKATWRPRNGGSTAWCTTSRRSPNGRWRRADVRGEGRHARAIKPHVGHERQFNAARVDALDRVEKRAIAQSR
jgi:hypothetical protein